MQLYATKINISTVIYLKLIISRAKVEIAKTNFITIKKLLAISAYQHFTSNT
ncbi:MAG: hypothetical protein AAF849_00530 [Bacteroidota bacterium]